MAVILDEEDSEKLLESLSNGCSSEVMQRRQEAAHKWLIAHGTIPPELDQYDAEMLMDVLGDCPVGHEHHDIRLKLERLAAWHKRRR